MNKIQLLTFQGCQTTVDLVQQLSQLLQKKTIDFEMEVITVTTPEKAEEIGLYGSPTLIINGEEYQKQPLAKAGFY